jgi:hypothetical protein
MFVGHDGGVYRREGDGNWQRRTNGAWAAQAGQAARQAADRAGFNQPSLNRPAGELRQEWQSRAPATRPGGPQIINQRPMNTIPQHNIARGADIARPATEIQRPNVNLNNEYQVRQQAQQRVQNFQQARPQIQQMPQYNRAPAGYNRAVRPAGGVRGGRR